MALVLSRKVNEKILIGEPGPDQITVTVVDIRGDKVRLDVAAPRDVPVHRQEVAAAIARGESSDNHFQARAAKRRSQAQRLLREADDLDRKAGGGA